MRSQAICSLYKPASTRGRALSLECLRNDRHSAEHLLSRFAIEMRDGKRHVDLGSAAAWTPLAAPRSPLFEGCRAERLGKQIGVDNPWKSSRVREDMDIWYLQAAIPAISAAKQISPTDMLSLIAVETAGESFRRRRWLVRRWDCRWG